MHGNSIQEVTVHQELWSIAKFVLIALAVVLVASLFSEDVRQEIPGLLVSLVVLVREPCIWVAVAIVVGILWFVQRK